MVSRLAIASTAAMLLSSSVAGLKVIEPNSDMWWVAESSNVLSWTCNDSLYEKFTVLITNNNVNIFTTRAIVGNQTNSDCYKRITQDQVNLPAERGYVILLANPIDNAEIYATSEEFEVRPIGSADPTTIASSGTLAKPTPSSSSPTSSSSPAVPLPSFPHVTVLLLFWLSFMPHLHLPWLSSWQDRWED